MRSPLTVCLVLTAVALSSQPNAQAAKEKHAKLSGVGDSASFLEDKSGVDEVDNDAEMSQLEETETEEDQFIREAASKVGRGIESGAKAVGSAVKSGASSAKNFAVNSAEKAARFTKNNWGKVRDIYSKHSGTAAQKAQKLRGAKQQALDKYHGFKGARSGDEMKAISNGEGGEELMMMEEGAKGRENFDFGGWFDKAVTKVKHWGATVVKYGSKALAAASELAKHGAELKKQAGAILDNLKELKSNFHDMDVDEIMSHLSDTGSHIGDMFGDVNDVLSSIEGEKSEGGAGSVGLPSDRKGSLEESLIQIHKRIDENHAGLPASGPVTSEHLHAFVQMRKARDPSFLQTKKSMAMVQVHEHDDADSESESMIQNEDGPAQSDDADAQQLLGAAAESAQDTIETVAGEDATEKEAMDAIEDAKAQDEMVETEIGELDHKVAKLKALLAKYPAAGAIPQVKEAMVKLEAQGEMLNKQAKRNSDDKK